MEVLTMRKQILLFFLLLAVFSCRQADPGWPDERLQNWLDYYDSELKDFGAGDHFDRPYRVEQAYQTSDDDLFVDLYVYSPDSTRAIDLDSYHLVLEVKDDGSLFSPGREADMEVALIDLEQGIRKRLLFCGPPCIFEEATFHPDGHVVVAGFIENNNGFHPALWTIKTKNGFVELRQSPRLVPPGNILYISDKRLHHINFWFEKYEGIATDIPL